MTSGHASEQPVNMKLMIATRPCSCSARITAPDWFVRAKLGSAWGSGPIRQAAESAVMATTVRPVDSIRRASMDLPSEGLMRGL
jgi:hypothetical protein